MSDNWVVQNLQNALDTWNEKLAEVWKLLTQSPENFKGGAIWDVILNIHGALKAIGLALLVLFFVVGVVKTCGSFTEINFFVEDKDKEYEYETILSRLFKNRYKITSIIAANGKIGVKNAFYEFGEVDKDNNEKNNFYLVDGDFDRYIHQEGMMLNSHFIYLKYYNIENYFIDESAIVKFVKGRVHMTDSKVYELVEIPMWRNKIIEQAKPLFLLYCAVQNNLPTEPNVARNEYLFIDDKTGFEKAGAYDMYFNHIVSLDDKIIEEVNEVAHLYETINGNDYFGLICGKFLLTSLYTYLSGKTKKRFSRNDLRWSLLCDFDESSLKFIEDAVDAVLNKC